MRIINIGVIAVAGFVEASGSSEGGDSPRSTSLFKQISRFTGSLVPTLRGCSPPQCCIDGVRDKQREMFEKSRQEIYDTRAVGNHKAGAECEDIYDTIVNSGYDQFVMSPILSGSDDKTNCGFFDLPNLFQDNSKATGVGAVFRIIAGMDSGRPLRVDERGSLGDYNTVYNPHDAVALASRRLGLGKSKDLEYQSGNKLTQAWTIANSVFALPEDPSTDSDRALLLAYATSLASTSRILALDQGLVAQDTRYMIVPCANMDIES